MINLQLIRACFSCLKRYFSHPRIKLACFYHVSSRGWKLVAKELRKVTASILLMVLLLKFACLISLLLWECYPYCLIFLWWWQFMLLRDVFCETDFGISLEQPFTLHVVKGDWRLVGGRASDRDTCSHNPIDSLINCLAINMYNSTDQMAHCKYWKGQKCICIRIRK